ncbi:MAG: hypothetical protein ACKVTZ_16070 [Bacteroidia bacterium]
MKKLHYFSAMVITVFTLFHLSNHLTALHSIATHIEVNRLFRLVYRNPLIETTLMLCVAFQIVSGLLLWRKGKEKTMNFFEKLQRWSGLYLSLFLLGHPIAVWAGRLWLHLDTNFYFGAMVLNVFPYLILFFIYYSLAIFFFFSHLAAVHYQKMQQYVSEPRAKAQSYSILALALGITFLIFYAFTGGFQGIEIPTEYKYLP